MAKCAGAAGGTVGALKKIQKGKVVDCKESEGGS